MPSPHRTPPREHRDAAALLTEAAARARAGTGVAVLLRGATGTGRSTVLAAAAGEAAAHGMRVLRARCSPHDAAEPFAAVLRLLGADPPAASAASAASADERAAGARLRQILHGYAQDGPLFVAVDDAHLADGPSRRWLVECARHLDQVALPILLAVTERAQYDVEPPAPDFTHGLSPAFVHTRTLLPLTAGSAAALVRTAFPAADETWTGSCVRAGAASPLLLRALLDDLGAAGAPAAVPESVATLYAGAYPAAVAWWLESAGAATARVARLLAALDEVPEDEVPPGEVPVGGGGEDAGHAVPAAHDASAHTVPARRHPAEDAPTAAAGGTAFAPTDEPARLLAELAGADPARVAGWLTATTALGVLRPGRDGRPRYAHPLLRDAVLTGVPAAERRAAHANAAEVLLRWGAPAGAVGAHLLRAGPVGASWAPRALRDAAAAALRTGRPDRAAAHLRRALDEPLPDGDRLPLLTDLATLEYEGGAPAAAVPPLTEALGLAGTPRDRARVAVALGTALAACDRTAAGVEVLRAVEDGLAGPELLGTVRTAAALLADRDRVVRADLGRVPDVPDRLGPAPRALFVQDAARAGLISAGEAMRRVRALLAEPADPLTEPFVLAIAATVAQWADELDEAVRLAARLPHVLHPMHRVLRDVRADIAAARGAYAPLPAGPLRRTDARPTDRWAHVLTGLVETGRTAEAAALAQALAQALDRAEENEPGGTERFLHARGVQRAAAGDPAGALHDFLACGRRQTERGVLSPITTPWRTSAAECLLALGSPRQALTLAREELRLARVWGTPRVVGRALRVLGTVTGGRRGLETAEEAVALLRAAAGPVGAELVAALVAQGRQLVAAGERGRGRDALREAVERAERLSAPRLRALAEDALREGGARRPTAPRTGVASLTASEHRVALLAADGRTNAEISDALHVARRTVETHLTSAYRKLGIRRRTELTPALTPHP
jgi:DNA-binding CsgD family transcriptional regulator